MHPISNIVYSGYCHHHVNIFRVAAERLTAGNKFFDIYLIVATLVHQHEQFSGVTHVDVQHREILISFWSSDTSAKLFIIYFAGSIRVYASKERADVLLNSFLLISVRRGFRMLYE